MNRGAVSRSSRTKRANTALKAPKGPPVLPPDRKRPYTQLQAIQGYAFKKLKKKFP